MKATLLPRQNVRVTWFTAEKVKFSTDRKVEFSHSPASVQQSTIKQSPQFQFVFLEVPKQVPATQIIIFDQKLGLPESYSKTDGSVGSRLPSTWAPDLELEVTDRLVTYTEGKETIKIEPAPPHRRNRVKEIEIRERTDVSVRKVTLKNLTNRPMSTVRVVFSENKDVRFESAKIPPSQKDPPEYTWVVAVPADGSVSVEFSLQIHVTKTFEIEFPPEERPASQGPTRQEPQRRI